MKRFYKDVTVEPCEGGARLLLDGRTVRTPSKAELVLPTDAFAKAVAAEWKAQGDKVDPTTMPLTRYANSAIDGVSQKRAEVIASIVGYGGTDHICYWAEGPEALIARQEALWRPVLVWAEGYLEVPIVTAAGVLAVEQDPHLGHVLHTDVDALDDFALVALHELTTLLGSVLLGLAITRGGTDAETAWVAAHVDETFQAEQWGEDAEAAVRIAHRRAAFDDAVRALQLLGVTP